MYFTEGIRIAATKKTPGKMILVLNYQFNNFTYHFPGGVYE